MLLLHRAMHCSKAKTAAVLGSCLCTGKCSSIPSSVLCISRQDMRCLSCLSAQSLSGSLQGSLTELHPLLRGVEGVFGKLSSHLPPQFYPPCLLLPLLCPNVSLGRHSQILFCHPCSCSSNGSLIPWMYHSKIASFPLSTWHCPPIPSLTMSWASCECLKWKGLSRS